MNKIGEAQNQIKGWHVVLIGVVMIGLPLVFMNLDGIERIVQEKYTDGVPISEYIKETIQKEKVTAVNFVDELERNRVGIVDATEALCNVGRWYDTALEKMVRLGFMVYAEDYETVEESPLCAIDELELLHSNVTSALYNCDQRLSASVAELRRRSDEIQKLSISAGRVIGNLADRYLRLNMTVEMSEAFFSKPDELAKGREALETFTGLYLESVKRQALSNCGTSLSNL